MSPQFPHVYPTGSETCANCHEERDFRQPLCPDTVLERRMRKLAGILLDYATGQRIDKVEAELAWMYREDARQVLTDMPHLLPLDIREYMEERGFRDDPMPTDD